MLAGAGDVQLRRCAEAHLAVRADHDLEAQLGREAGRVDGPLESRALAHVEADDVRGPRCGDPANILPRVHGLVRHDRQAQRADLAHPFEVGGSHGLLDERNRALAQAWQSLERGRPRPPAVRVGADERLGAGKRADACDPGRVCVRIASDLHLEGAKTETLRRIEAGVEFSTVAAQRDLHGNLAAERASEELADGQLERAPERVPHCGLDPAFVNALARTTRSNSIPWAAIGASGFPSRSGANTSRTKCVAVTASSPLHAAVALISP